MESEYISKERLREIIGDVNEVCPYKVPGDYDTYSQHNEGWQDACNMIESMVDAEDGAEVVPLDYHERCLELEVERRMEAERPNRVLTLDEALGSEDPVWHETPDRSPRIDHSLRIVSIHVAAHPAWAEWLGIGRSAPFIAPLDEYNKTWRCWLRKPTAEEMAKEAWENDQH